MTEDRSAALLIRVWLEGESNVFRARLSAVDTSGGVGVGAGVEGTFALASTESDALDAVRRWLEDFSGPPRNPIDTPAQ